MYRYHVTYSHSRGTGACAMNLRGPITGWGAIETIMGFLADGHPELTGFVVMAWQRYEDAPVPAGVTS